MVLHQDLAVLRSCSYFFLLSLFSCPAAVSLSIMPSCVRSTLGARAPQWEGCCCSRDARPQRCEKERADSEMRGWEGHPPTPFPFEDGSWVLMLTSTNGLPFSGAWITCSRIIAPDDDCNGQLLPPGLMVSP